jgi:PAS domain S-box-containing protein
MTGADQTQLIGGLALVIQLAAAVYALRMNRVFGTDRAGWSLFGAFSLMLAVRVGDVWLSSNDSSFHMVHLISSVLLLIGLAHVSALFKERIRNEQLARSNRDELEARVRERTLELARANALLHAEVAIRARAEREIKDSQTRYENLVNSLDCVVFEARKPDLRFTFISPQCEALLGHTPDQLLGQPAWRNFVHPDDLQSVLASFSLPSVATEFRALAKNGREVWMRLLAAAAPEGENTALLRGVLLDITEWRRMETQLEDAQKLECIQRLAGGVAHDFNNILTVIQGHAACLLTLDHLPEPVLDSIRAIHDGSSRAAQVTSQLLAFSQERKAELNDLDLNNAVDRALQSLQPSIGKEITLHVELSAASLPVRGDCDLLEQMLMGLAQYARERMPKGGQLKIQTSLATMDHDYAAHGQRFVAGRYSRIMISDTGQTIAPNDLPRVFEPFFAREAGKVPALGLATAYAIVRQHCGWITVFSAPGQGTTFNIYLPLSTEPAQPAPPDSSSPASARAHGGSETILVTEDQAPVRNLLSHILSRLGYQVIEAESGAAALEIWPACRDRVDLLLTDIIMPGGINGWELADRLTADKPGLKIICTSGYSPETLRAKSKHRLLRKPYDLKELARGIREVLGSGKPTALPPASILPTRDRSSAEEVEPVQACS